ncbi:MAG TPA: peptide-methionine (S)-S-oxide reductase MsrA [Thermoanaerobaculia bacterium]
MKIVAALSLSALLGLFGSRPGGAATAPPAPGQPLAKAAFAGGCFWCMVHPFDQIPGVVKVTSGYAGGRTKHPTYEEVSSGETGHAESVEVVYDPAKVTYQKLLDTYWHNVDPFTANAQFCDHGEQYRTAIFYATPEQKKLAEQSKAELQHRFKDPIVTQIVPLTEFWPAEDYHQDYYKKNPVRYKFYRYNCGRDRRLSQIWGAAPAE